VVLEISDDSDIRFAQRPHARKTLGVTRVAYLPVAFVLSLACSRVSTPGANNDAGAGATSTGGAAAGGVSGTNTGGSVSNGGAATSTGGSSVGAGTGAGGSASSGGSGPNTADGGAGATTASGGVTAGGASLPQLENDTESGVFVHLFEWRWADIALECENFLGPKGFTAVQVSPPSEHALLPDEAFPWWQRYQVVSYELESRSGSRTAFVDMVARCRAAGVGIYVDAVLNHTTGITSGAGSNGTRFTKYAYPDLYTQADFHAPICQIQDADYVDSAERVQRCELLGLADLDTGSPTVRSTLAGYLSDLLQIGVRGFRLDAAKHMAPADLAAILAQVKPRPNEVPYYFLEVSDYGGGAVHATDYLDVGGNAELDVTEFKYGGVGDIFLGRNGQSISSLTLLNERTWGLLPSERAVTFIENHDTQRVDADFYQNGPAHDLATVFMLAWPYGYPSVMSSYGFDRTTSAGRDAGPPTDGGGSTHPIYEVGTREPSCVPGPYTNSTRGFICEHRARYVSALVLFRKTATGAAVANVWTNGKNQLAFSRGARAFVAINHESTALSQSLKTGLPAGTYCDVLSGDYTPKSGDVPANCGGKRVEVDASGNAAIEVAAESALALHVAAKL
jgi:alpha-amylase